MNHQQGPLSPSLNSSDRSRAGRSSSGTSSPNKPPRQSPYGRGNLPTPPVSAHSSNGMNGPLPIGMNGRPPNFEGRPQPSYGSRDAPSPPASIGRSSNGTQLSDSQQRMKQGRIEQDLLEHFRLLKPFANGGPNAPDAAKPNRARDKLTRLSPGQFQELSQDVFDELRRRKDEQRIKEFNTNVQDPRDQRRAPPFLEPKKIFHPKRNQARQKLSTLPPPRFRALAADVTYELEQRFPHFAGEGIGRMGSPGMPGRMGSPGPMGMGRRGPNGSLGGQIMAPGMGPQQKSSQSNTVVPNKSYLVEDDDGDLESVYGNRRDTTQTSKSYAMNDKILNEYQDEIEGLKDKIKNLEQSSQDKDDQISKLEGSKRDPEAEADWARLRTSLEDKVADAQALNDSLQSEIDKIKGQHQDRERDLQNQMDIMTSKSNDDGEWRARYNEVQQESNSLKRENQDLQDSLTEQQKSSGIVRRELQGFVSELKSIQERNDQSTQREERLSLQVQTLEADIRLWKNRCAKMKTQLRSQTGSVMLTQPDAVREAFVRPGGLIQHVHLTSFQLSIDETLRGARGGDLSILQETLKSAVTAVRDICQDIRDSAPADAKKQRGKVSAMANNFITATKNFIASKGISPVSLLDAAASNLSTAVVDLVSLVKMKPSSDSDVDLAEVPEEADDDLDMVIPEPEKGNKYYSTNGRSSVSESVYSITTGYRASERFLPTTTYQDPRSSRGLAVNGLSNGFNKGSHRPQLSATSQSSYNSIPPPRAEQTGLNGQSGFGTMSSDSSRQPSFNYNAPPAPPSLSTSSDATTGTTGSLATPVPVVPAATGNSASVAVIELSKNLDSALVAVNTVTKVLTESIRGGETVPQVRIHVLSFNNLLSQALDEVDEISAKEERFKHSVNPIMNALNAARQKVSEMEQEHSLRDCAFAAFSVRGEYKNLNDKVKAIVSKGYSDDSEEESFA